MDVITLGVVFVLAILAFRTIIHIVPEYERLIVFRLGAFEKVAGPGIVLMLPPPIQTVAQTVDLREFVIELQKQVCVTKDRARVSIDLLVYQRVIDAAASFLNVQNFRPAVLALAAKALRSAVSEIPSDQILAERDHIGDDLREELDEVTRRWGVKITNIEIKELTLASGVKGAA